MGINVNKVTGLKINPSNQINIFNDSNSGDFYNIIERRITAEKAKSGGDKINNTAFQFLFDYFTKIEGPDCKASQQILPSRKKWLPITNNLNLDDDLNYFNPGNDLFKKQLMLQVQLYLV